jgi:hypothetical protein
MMKLLAAPGAVLVLAACSTNSAPPPAPATTPASTATAAATTTTAARPTSVPVAAGLPPAPPLEQWVEKGSDFQQTIDLQMRTQLIKLGVAPIQATDTAARDLAYLVCSTLRAGVPKDQVNELIQTTYPAADGFDGLSILVTAQGYCLDTF